MRGPKNFFNTFLFFYYIYRKNERNGIDYNFVTRSEMEKDIQENCFIEFGEFNGNLYGTKFDSITKIIRGGKMPILNLHETAIEKLRTSEFLPIVIFVKPPYILLLKVDFLFKEKRFEGSKHFEMHF